MIRKILTLITVCLLVCGIIIPANAANIPTISVGTAVASPGNEVTLNVDFVNNPGISSYTLSFDYDESRLLLTDVLFNEAFGTNAVYYSKAVWIGNNNINADGTFLSLKFNVLDSAEVGDAFVSASYIKGDICNYDEEDVDFAISPGKVSICKEQIKRGDLNGDGKVNASDMAILKKVIVGKAANTEYADVNCDGKTNAADMALLKKIIVGKA